MSFGHQRRDHMPTGHPDLATPHGAIMATTNESARVKAGRVAMKRCDTAEGKGERPFPCNPLIDRG